MRRFIGGLLGFAVLALRTLLPIVIIAGISALIGGTRVLHGPQPKGSPQYNFTLGAMPPAMMICGYFVLYRFVLPIWAKFGVRVERHSSRKKT
jgi:hypothetical protein